MFDLFLLSLALPVLAEPLVLVAVLVRITSKGPSLYWSARVGRDNQIFQMPKFRTMRVGIPVVATHLLNSPESYLTPIGSFMRKSGLDELPQLWSLLKGVMSFVGPRPALLNWGDLIALRFRACVHVLVPGLMGWAKVNGRDELPVPQKVQLDAQCLLSRSFALDLRILWVTALKALARDGVSH